MLIVTNELYFFSLSLSISWSLTFIQGLEHENKETVGLHFLKNLYTDQDNLGMLLACGSLLNLIILLVCYCTEVIEKTLLL